MRLDRDSTQVPQPPRCDPSDTLHRCAQVRTEYCRRFVSAVLTPEESTRRESIRDACVEPSEVSPEFLGAPSDWRDCELRLDLVADRKVLRAASGHARKSTAHHWSCLRRIGNAKLESSEFQIGMRRVDLAKRVENSFEDRHNARR